MTDGEPSYVDLDPIDDSPRAVASLLARRTPLVHPEAQLALRTVRSPLSGVVVERYVNLGERVEERPLMRVAVIDPLRVELMVPTAMYGAPKRLAVSMSKAVIEKAPSP